MVSQIQMAFGLGGVRGMLDDSQSRMRWELATATIFMYCTVGERSGNQSIVDLFVLCT